MRLTAIMAILFLSGCVTQVPDTRLVCSVDSRETYRSRPRHFWKLTDGVWWTDLRSIQYKPSVLESCYTEAVQ